MAHHLDGVDLEGDYWVIAKAEYFRVVPEASRQDFDSEEVLIPTFVAQLSFRPEYIKAAR